MSNYLSIENLSKEEFITLLENTIEKKLDDSKSNSSPEYLSVQEVAKLLKLSEITIYNYVKKGILPSKKVGRRHRFLVSEIESILQESKSLKYKRNG